MTLTQGADLIGAGLVAFAYALLTALLLANARRDSRLQAPARALVAAAAITAADGLLRVAAPTLAAALPLRPALVGVETLRTAAWLLFLLLLLRFCQPERVRGALAAEPTLRIGVGLVVVAFVSLVLQMAAPAAEGVLGQLDLMVRLGLAVLGLVLVETIFRTTAKNLRWAVKHALTGLGALSAFDLALYSHAVLGGEAEPLLFTARLYASLVIVPLLLVSVARLRDLQLDVAFSRQAALHTSALIASGLYLMGVAGLAALIDATSLPLGPLLAALGAFLALLLLVLLLVSETLRARARAFIARHFFTFAYDYRAEWLRFTRTMTASLEGDLYHRAIHAVAQVFDFGRGALYLRQPPARYVLAARWNWGDAASMASLPPALAERLQSAEPLALAGPDAAALPDDPETASWLAQFQHAWWLLPCPAGSDLVAIVALGQPLAPRPMTGEDRDLLRTLAVQVASYVAQDQAARALFEARQFEQISRNFSFVAHDLKNLVSQLQLILRHADRHGDKPEFRRDMLATIQDSVEKMRAMLVRLREEDGRDRATPRELGALVTALVGPRLPTVPQLRLGAVAQSAWVRVEAPALSAVVDNLIQNALEAIGPEGSVTVSVAAGEERVSIVVADDGPGMTESFVHERLYRPFRSGKEGGFGIGLYQAREIVERVSGRFLIDTAPGQGTRVTLAFPRIKPPTVTDG